MMIKKDNILHFKTFLKYPEVVHGFSTREFGSMRAMGMPESLKHFASSLKINPQRMVRMNQVHSSNVVWLGSPESNKTEAAVMGIDNTDGVLTSEKELFLSVITADCVPVLLYDQKKKIVGAVHAGWRGAYKGIVNEVIEKLQEKGSAPDDIIVGVGPCIRSCCYDIAEEHADIFRTKFPDWQDILVQRDGKNFLDLPKLVQYQLQLEGIPATNMEDAGICTYESEELYSYRREGEGFGEFVGIIGHSGAKR